MRILKVISLLLDYPTQELVAGRDELEQAIIQAWRSARASAGRCSSCWS